MSWMPERELVAIGFVVDTNCVNSRQAIPEMNQLEKWAEDGLFTMLTAEVAQNEMIAGNDTRRSSKAYSFIFTMSEIGTSQESAFIKRIEQILFPGGAVTQGQKNDVEIVFNASKYMYKLITNDGGSKSQPGGILGNRSALAELGIEVMTPAEAVALVRAELEFRDESARRMAELMGCPIPEWVGAD